MREGFARIGQRLDVIRTEPEHPRRVGAWKWPRKMNMLTFVQAAPGLFSDWSGLRTAVPGDFVTLDADDDGKLIAVIACPCGESPAVPSLGLRTCNCNRVFAEVGHGEVRVWRPPMTDEEFAD